MSLFSDPRWSEALAHLPDYLGNHVPVSIAALALGLVCNTQPMVDVVQHGNLEANVASLLAGSLRYNDWDRRPFDESIQRDADCPLNLGGLGA